MGSKTDFFKLSNTRERSQWGAARLTAGFSKSLLLITSERTGWEEKSTDVKCFRVEAIADLYPLMEAGKSFFSSKSKIRKSAKDVTVGSMGSILLETPIHPSVPAGIVQRLCGRSLGSTDSLGRFFFRKSCLLETSLQHSQACRLYISGLG